MRILRALAVLSFAAGALILAAGFLWDGADEPQAPAENGRPFEGFNLPAPPRTTFWTAVASTATTAPTPTPYAGGIARFRIERFEVNAAVENVGLIPGENQLDVPKDPLNVGWYDIYDRPGWGGNAVFSAHVDYWPDIRGPFFELYKLEPGDEVSIAMDDGTEYRYRVFRKQRYEATSIPMGDLIWPPEKEPGTEWITLITCGGRFRAYLNGDGAGEYLDRDVVVAERVS